MPIINNSSGFQIHGGTFYSVSGDVNLHTHQYLTLQDHHAHRAFIQPPSGAAGALNHGTPEGYRRESSGLSRNVRNGMAVSSAPYDMSSRPRSLARSSSDLEERAGSQPSTLSEASWRPRLDPIPQSMPEFNPTGFSYNSQYLATNDSSNSLPYLGDISPMERQNPPAFLIPSDRVRVPNYRVDRPDDIPSHRASSFGPQFRYESRFERLQGQTSHGSTFITAENVNHRHGETGIHILHRAVAIEALYNSADSFSQPRCHPETRVKMLDSLYRVIASGPTRESILWLHGPAGAGKSAIMQTLCKRLQKAGRFGSFFFKRDHTTRGNAKVLFATLAYQLALHNRHLKPPISLSVESDPSVVGSDMEIQLHKLIIEPCQLLTRAAPLILLIDGLDECENQNTQLEILRLLGKVARDHPGRLKMLIATRPEPHIREKFDELSFHGLYDSVSVEQSFEDVRRYLCDEFVRIHREHQETMANIPAPWPSSDILAMLVEKSSGYFIYASTVIKFIDDKHFRLTEQLDLVLNFTCSDSDSPFEALDQLYIQIISAGPVRYRSRLCDILCVVVTSEKLCLQHIEQLLELEAGDVRLTLRSMHSVLKIPTGRDPIYAQHASFLFSIFCWIKGGHRFFMLVLGRNTTQK